MGGRVDAKVKSKSSDLSHFPLPLIFADSFILCVDILYIGRYRFDTSAR